MSTLKNGAFAAVDAFYGVGCDETLEQKVLHTETHPQLQLGKRLGVGATTTTGSSSQRTNNKNTLLYTEKSILQVGSHKKRQRRHGFGDHDDDDESVSSAQANVVDGDNNNNDDDDDEEEARGRTAIDSVSKNFTTTFNPALILAERAVSTILQQNGKKKMGKKERQRSAVQQQTIPSTTDQPKNPIEEGCITDNLHDNSSSSSCTPHIANDQESLLNKRKQRRRRKVRSKQKNIYKDKRDVKPAHLIPGNSNYQGRPLTVETQTKLSMTKIVPSPFASDVWIRSGNNDK